MKYLDKEVNKDYEFILVRNPFDRIVSFYTSKVVYQDIVPWDIVMEGSKAVNQYLERVDWEAHGEKPIPLINAGSTSMTFEEFIYFLQNKRPENMERHLKPQTMYIDGKEFDKVVKLENFEEDIKEVCEVLDLEYEDIVNQKAHRLDKDSSINEPVWNNRPAWFRQNGIPTDYSLFYTQQLQVIVKDLYEADFKRFNYGS